VAIDVQNDGLNGVFAYQDATVDTFPNPEDTVSDPNEARQHLLEAERWLKSTLQDRQLTFDVDGDSISNLEEACAGTLFQP